MRRLFPILLSVIAGPALAQSEGAGRILVVAASSGDYIWGAGATLAQFIKAGWRVDVAQCGNGEKRLPGVTPAEARLAAMEEATAAAKALGVTDLVRLEHKSGEFGYVSSTEMRNQLFALIRGIKPKILFIPDPYVHYQDDRDFTLAGFVAEEAWGYSGGGSFANELARMGLAPYGAPEVFYYTPMRPYRAGEGGEAAKARFAGRDIAGAAFQAKLTAISLLTAYNRGWLHIRTGKPFEDAAEVARHAARYAEELARAIGVRHGFQLGEEFNHVGPVSDPIPAYALDKARPRRTTPPRP